MRRHEDQVKLKTNAAAQDDMKENKPEDTEIGKAENGSDDFMEPTEPRTPKAVAVEAPTTSGIAATRPSRQPKPIKRFILEN